MVYGRVKESKVIIANELGLHARAAGVFAREAIRFSSDIWVMKDSMRVNGKSIMDLLTLAAPKGSDIIIAADGDDEGIAIEALTSIVEKGFGEE